MLPHTTQTTHDPQATWTLSCMFSGLLSNEDLRQCRLVCWGLREVLDTHPWPWDLAKIPRVLDHTFTYNSFKLIAAKMSRPTFVGALKDKHKNLECKARVNAEIELLYYSVIFLMCILMPMKGNAGTVTILHLMSMANGITELSI